MAQKVEVLLIDDLEGGSADETVRFGLDGVAYEIDLSDGNAAKLREALTPYVQRARKSSSSRAPRSRTSRGRGGSSRERSAEIRSWARQQGISVNERGRIPSWIVEKYQAAH